MADDKTETPVPAAVATAPAVVQAPKAQAKPAPKTFADSIPAGVISSLTGATKLNADQVKEAINALKLGPAASDEQVAVGNELFLIYGPAVKYGDGAFFPGAFDVNPAKAAAASEGGDKKK